MNPYDWFCAPEILSVPETIQFTQRGFCENAFVSPENVQVWVWLYNAVVTPVNNPTVWT